MKGIPVFIAGIGVGLALIISCGRGIDGGTGGAVVFADGTALTADQVLARFSAQDSQISTLQAAVDALAAKDSEQQSRIDALAGENRMVGGCELDRGSDGHDYCRNLWGSGSCTPEPYGADENCTCSAGTQTRISFTGGSAGIYGCLLP